MKEDTQGAKRRLGLSQWFRLTLGLHQPPAGVEYPFILDVLDDDGRPNMVNLFKCVGGLIVAVISFIVLVQGLALGLSQLFWVASGSVGDFNVFFHNIQALETPVGMLVSHLSLGLLIVIVFGLAVFLHRIPGRWLSSVQPGFRWRYLFVCLGVAVMLMVAFLWVSNGFTFASLEPEGSWGWFMLVILLTTPLQAAGEEYFFRGYLMTVMVPPTRSKWIGVVGSAVFFALFHGSSQNWALLADRFAFGLLAGALVIVTGGLEAAIAAHAANNLVAFSYATLTSSVAAVRAQSEIGWGDAALDIGGYAVIMVVVVLLGRRMQVATKVH